MRPARPLREVMRFADAALRVEVDAAAHRHRLHGRRDIAIFEPDPRRFVADLFGAWQAGARVWLAADRQPATLQALRALGVDDEGSGEPASQGRAAPSRADHNDEALVLFTSGSTGAPLPIVKTFRQLDAEIAALEQAFGARLGDAAVQGTVSHQHIYGLLFRVLWPMATGRDFAAARIEYPSQWATQAGAGDVLVATPSLLESWPEDVAYPRPTAVFSSGGRLAPDSAARIAAQLGAPVMEVFGSTETGGIAWRDAERAGAWQALPGVAWRVDDGQLALRSPHLPEPDAWVRTTDRVEAHEGGGFALLGRADRIAKVGEKRVSLDGLEAQLRATGLVSDVRALVVPGLRRGLAVVAVPTDAGRACWRDGGRRALSAELRHALLAHIEPAAVPRRWRFVDALPRNAQGKVTEAALAALFRPRAPALVASVSGDDGRVVTLDVPQDLLFFDGHFDAAPVVPGVVLLEWAITQVEAWCGLKPPLAGIDVLKFQKLVLPGSRLSLRLSRAAAASTVGFAYESAEGSHASGRLRYVEGSAA